MGKSRESSNNPLKGKQNRTNKNLLQISFIGKIYSDSRGIRMPNLDWLRGGAGDGGG